MSQRHALSSKAGNDVPPEPSQVPLMTNSTPDTGRGNILRDSEVTRQSRVPGVHTPEHSASHRSEFTGNISHTQSRRSSTGNVSILPSSEHSSQNSHNPFPSDNHPKTPVPPPQHQCPICLRVFTTKIGLGVHKKLAHKEQANEEIDLKRKKHRWQDEDLRRYAREEALTPPSVRFINEHLFAKVQTDQKRTPDSIKSMRKSAKYKALVIEYKNNLATATSPTSPLPTPIQNLTPELPPPMSSSNCVIPDPSTQTIHEHPAQPSIPPTHEPASQIPPDPTQATVRTALHDSLKASLHHLQTKTNADPGDNYLKNAILNTLHSESPEENLTRWYFEIFPDLLNKRPHKPWRACHQGPEHLSRRKQRVREYAQTQSLWAKNMSKAAKIHPSLEVQEAFWRPILEETEHIEPQPSPDVPAHTHYQVMRPVISTEINLSKPNAKTASGPDNLKVSRWIKGVDDSNKATVMNIILAWGQVPRLWRDSRTILIPKEDGTMDPAKFRPISISSVILRHLHRILAKKLLSLPLLDERQRGFIEADGLAENVFTLASVLREAKSKLKQVHIAMIDVKKAFDTVDHTAIQRVLRKKGLPPDLNAYLAKLYGSAHTVLEVGGKTSQPIHPERGVRQGDPIASMVFDLIEDEIITVIPEEIGFVLDTVLINALAFADDLVLIASTKQGLQSSINKAIEAMRKQGLSAMPQKCCALSLIPSGRDKKVKVMTQPLFTINGQKIMQLGVNDTWKHLGVQFGSNGPLAPKIQIETYLSRVTKAPLKPQQRLKILRTFLIPRFLHALVFGNTTFGLLRKLDIIVRKYVRGWLRLPTDVPIAFLHAPISEGGLGIMSFETKIPELTLRRLNALKDSRFSIAKVINTCSWVINKRKWCNMAKRRDDEWTRRLHQSTDGWELRESSRAPPSYQWLEDPRLKIPSRDWIQYLRTRINALPSLMRTTRGLRRQTQPSLCRAGCGKQETTAHIIQQCHRTHGGRILRHDAVAAKIAASLSATGFDVRREEIISTTAGNRKPDIIAATLGGVYVLDVQVVSGNKDLEQQHLSKRRYYAQNNDLLKFVSDRFSVPISKVQVSTVTVSWRGIWCRSSYNTLASMGISRGTMTGLTTRILQGSHTNFSRFGQMTTMANHQTIPWRPG